MRSRRGEVSAACFVHDGSDTLRRESVEEADVSDCLQLSLQVLRGQKFLPGRILGSIILFFGPKLLTPLNVSLKSESS